MKRITTRLALALALLPMAGTAQITDPVLRNVLEVLKGADPKLLNPNWPGGLPVAGEFAGNILSQNTGPDAYFRGGGSRSTQELDAFAEELIALAIANTPSASLDVGLQQGRMSLVRACLLLSDAYDHGNITLQADGSLAFEPGGVPASDTRNEMFHELGLGRFVTVDGFHSGTGPCGLHGMMKMKRRGSGS